MALFGIKLVNVNATVVPLTETAVTGLLTLFAVTAKSPAAGSPVTVSLVVSVTVLLPAFATCAPKVGVWKIVPASAASTAAAIFSAE